MSGKNKNPKKKKKVRGEDGMNAQKREDVYKDLVQMLTEYTLSSIPKLLQLRHHNLAKRTQEQIHTTRKEKKQKSGCSVLAS